MSPEQFTSGASAWITAVTAVVELLLVKAGLLAAAWFAWWLSVKKKDAEVRSEIETIKARQDRHSDRLTAQGQSLVEVAKAIPPLNGIQQVEVVNQESDPIPTTTQEA